MTKETASERGRREDGVLSPPSGLVSSLAIADAPGEILGGAFDAYAYLCAGMAVDVLPAPVADRVLAKVRDLPFVAIGSDMGTTHAREVARLDTGTPGGRFVHGVFAGLLRGDLDALCRHYGVRDDPSTITVLRLGVGYHLDWHSHLRSGGAASLLLYLFDVGDGEGGEFEQGRVGPDLETVTLTRSVKPTHGTLVLLGDGSHPLNRHRAREWRGAGRRYIVSFAYNARDW